METEYPISWPSPVQVSQGHCPQLPTHHPSKARLSVYQGSIDTPHLQSSVCGICRHQTVHPSSDRYQSHASDLEPRILRIYHHWHRSWCPCRLSCLPSSYLRRRTRCRTSTCRNRGGGRRRRTRRNDIHWSTS